MQRYTRAQRETEPDHRERLPELRVASPKFTDAGITGIRQFDWTLTAGGRRR